MPKTFLVAWRQIKKVALHWSFLLVVFYPPLLLLILGVYAGFVAWASSLKQSAESLPAPGMVITNAVVFDKPVGLVDLADLITTIPADLASENLLAFSSEAEAQVAVQSGVIAGYYLIPPDIVQSGLVTYFSSDTVQFTQTDTVIKKLITLNLAGAQGEAVARRLIGSVRFEQRLTPLAAGLPPDVPDIYTAGEVGLGVGLAFFVYFTIGSMSGLFLNQLAQEREGRILEVILSALTPLQLLTGKFIGILVVGLIETGAWFFWVQLFGFIGEQLSTLNATAAGGPVASGDGLAFSLSGLVYIGGYVAYAATAAVFGALVKDTRQASRINFLVALVALSPLAWLMSVLTDRDGLLAVGLSVFPLTAPVMMPLRLFISPVPGWQVGLSLLLLTAWTILMLRLAARLFQARLLLHDAPLRQLLWPRAGSSP